MKKNMPTLFTVLLLAVVIIIGLSACDKKEEPRSEVNSLTTSVAPTESQTQVQVQATEPVVNKLIDPVDEKPAAPISTPSKADKYKVVGTDLGNKLISELVASYKQKTGKSLIVNREGLASTGGLKAISTDYADLGAVTRPLTGDEKGLSLKENIIAYEAIAIVVNNSNSVKNLTVDQVRKIYTGEVKNWSELGGSGGQIQVYFQMSNSDNGEHVNTAMNELLKLEKLSSDGKKKIPIITKKAISKDNDQGIIEAVSQQENAIGVITFKNVDNAAIYPVDINGVEPSLENVRAGKYGLSIPFIIISKQEPKPEMKSLVDYITGMEGQKSIDAKGYISLLKQ